jgi:adenylate cyclase
MTHRAKALLRVAVIAGVALLLALGLARTSWHRALENAYYDWWHVLAGVRHAPRHAAVVAVDDETLAALKDDPLAFWAPHFGRALEALGQVGAAAIGLDFLYQVSAEGWLRKLDLPESDVSRSYHAPLRAALAKGNGVLITHLVTLKHGAELLAPPADQLIALPRGIHDLGVANLFPDRGCDSSEARLRSVRSILERPARCWRSEREGRLAACSRQCPD